MIELLAGLSWAILAFAAGREMKRRYGPTDADPGVVDRAANVSQALASGCRTGFVIRRRQ